MINIGLFIEQYGARDQSDIGMDGREEKETDEIDKIAFAYACSHPRTVMVLVLNAYTASVAMERTRWFDDFACRTHCQFVCFPVGIDQTSSMEAVLIEEMRCPIAIKIAERFGLIFNN